jgi:hypothetical protein
LRSELKKPFFSLTASRRALGQLAQDLLLLAGELGRDRHLDVDVVVAVAAAAEHRDALALAHDDVVRLGPGLDLELDVALQGSATSTVQPSAAWTMPIVTLLWMSNSSRWNRGSASTLTTT